MARLIATLAGAMLLCIALCWEDFQQGYKGAQKPGPLVPEKGKPEPPPKGTAPHAVIPIARKPRDDGSAKKDSRPKSAEAKRQFDSGVEQLHGRLDALKARLDTLDETQLKQWEDRIRLREKLVEHELRLTTFEFGSR